MHVHALRDQVAKWAPQAEFLCLSDVSISGIPTMPLLHRFPGWWAKMELFSPEVPADFLFMDLDTVIIGPLDDILAVRKTAMLRDFYRNGVKYKEGLGGGLFYLPDDEQRRAVWRYWIANPQLNMRLYPGGDQRLFERFYLNGAARWQDLVPNQVVSWKVHCQNGVPPEARIICMHGKPRPWEVGQFLHLYRG